MATSIERINEKCMMCGDKAEYSVRRSFLFINYISLDMCFSCMKKSCEKEFNFFFRRD